MQLYKNIYVRNVSVVKQFICVMKRHHKIVFAGGSSIAATPIGIPVKHFGQQRLGQEQ